MPPATAPPRLRTMRRRARPIVALARYPGPNTPAPAFISRRVRTGPFTMKSGAALLVVADTPCRSKASSHIASTPAMTTGMYSGRHPAITALTAIFSTVARPKLGGTRATSASAARPDAATAAETRPRVGGTTGKPSVTPRAYRISMGSSAGSTDGAPRSGAAGAKRRIVARGAALGVVGVGEYGDARGLRHLGFLEARAEILGHVGARLHPLALAGVARPEHEDLGEARAGREGRAHWDHRAPDVLEGLHRHGRMRP